MINFKVNVEDFLLDLENLIKLFFVNNSGQVEINQTLDFKHEMFEAKITINSFIFNYCRNINSYTKLDVKNLSDIEFKRIYKRFAKNALYFALKKYCKKSLPWGALTGVKPIRLIKNLIDVENYTIKEVKLFLKKEFNLSNKKLNLALSILKSEPKLNENENNICVYVNIPFCPEKCSYCSFISRVTKSGDKILIEYIDALIMEIRASRELYKNKIITSLYVGGGTPSILENKELEALLKELSKIKAKEFVFECGRADTLNEQKLALLKKYKVTRICVNPQTFNALVLEKINRHIANEQVVSTINMSKKKFIINCDLIAGLLCDTFKSFKQSVKTLCNLDVDNISVHSLAIKRNSEMFTNNQTSSKLVKKMLNFAIKYLCKNGYSPYYLYRLKNTFEGLENIGFCKNNTPCLFNTASMGEYQSILAFGANGISKKIDYKTNFISRVENPKDVSTYLKDLNKYIERKIKFFN